MSEIVLTSVFVNEEMYDRFFKKNNHVNGYRLIAIDNREDNRGLPTRYNAIIDQHREDNCWLFFVHEDFEIKENLESIKMLDKNAIYGTFGINLENHVPIGYGRHHCSNKDGTNCVEVGNEVIELAPVQTIDCQSILIHTSLLAQHPNLSFDEQLSFDLYAEDFVINAKKNYDIDTKIFPLKFQHYSHGKVTQRYHKGLKYLAKKYPDVAVAGSCSFIGGRASNLEKHFQYNIQANKLKKTSLLLHKIAKRLRIK